MERRKFVEERSSFAVRSCLALLQATDPCICFFNKEKTFTATLDLLQDYHIQEDKKGKRKEKGRSNTAALDPLYDCHIKKKFEKKRSQKSEEYSSSGPPPEPP